MNEGYELGFYAKQLFKAIGKAIKKAKAKKRMVICIGQKRVGQKARQAAKSPRADKKTKERIQKRKKEGKKEAGGKEKMTKYKCGHKGSFVFIRKTKIAQDVAVYEEWKKTVGLKGDKSMCLHCYWKSLPKWKQEMFKGYQESFEEWKKNKNKQEAGEKK